MTLEEYDLALTKLATEDILPKIASRFVPAQDASDVAQDVMRNLSRMPPAEVAAIRDLRKYATTAVRHHAINRFRKNSRASMSLGLIHPSVQDETRLTAEGSRERPEDPVECVEHAQRQKFLHDAIRCLDPLEKRALTAVRLEGDSIAEVARPLGLTVQEVRGALERALIKLHDMANSPLRSSPLRGEEDGE